MSNEQTTITKTGNMNGHISDLFFNTAHDEYASLYSTSKPAPTGGMIKVALREDALDFIQHLEGLGVPVPTQGELIDNFMMRI